MGRGKMWEKVTVPGVSEIALSHESKCRCARVSQSLLLTENAGCTGVCCNSKCWDLGSGKLCGEELAAAKNVKGWKDISLNRAIRRKKKALRCGSK